jgi:hypothetical protein
MRESRTYGSVRGALSNERPYRDRDRAVPTVYRQPHIQVVGSCALPTLRRFDIHRVR